MTLYWFGLHELEAKFGELLVATTPMVAAGLYEEGQEVLGNAMPIVPIDVGNLRASGHVTLPKIVGPEISVDVGFGGAAAPYAPFVHEILDARHNAPTQAKFLEKPALEHAPFFYEHMASRLARLVESV